MLQKSENTIISPGVRGKLLTYALIAIFGVTAAAQSLGDLAREERQKKASQTGAASPKVFSNLDNPPIQGTASTAPTTRHAVPAGESLLQIDSPADGTVVNPGQTIRVRVMSLTGEAISSVTVLTDMDDRLMTEPARSLPAEFSITVPSKISLHRYTLTATGITAARALVESAPIAIEVDRPDMPVSLSQVNFHSLIFDALGESIRLLTLATFPDGQVLDVTESSRLFFHSTDTKVVTVDETGAVTAVATGTAAIIVSYKNPNGPARELRIPVTVLRFQLGLTPSALNFGNVSVGSSASLTVTATNNSVSDSQMRIKAITVTGPYRETDNCSSLSPLALDASCLITVTFTPGTEGRFPGTLSIPDSSSSLPSELLLTGVGVK
ncbi:MAG: choice-of-anchor D domain-containing protein [Acidobacteriia bacterium]|nr:choice-of-anchor D domain-containing protein [Terriglobia bacterium]